MDEKLIEAFAVDEDIEIEIKEDGDYLNVYWGGAFQFCVGREGAVHLSAMLHRWARTKLDELRKRAIAEILTESVPGQEPPEGFVGEPIAPMCSRSGKSIIDRSTPPGVETTAFGIPITTYSPKTAEVKHHGATVGGIHIEPGDEIVEADEDGGGLEVRAAPKTKQISRAEFEEMWEVPTTGDGKCRVCGVYCCEHSSGNRGAKDTPSGHPFWEGEMADGSPMALIDLNPGIEKPPPLSVPRDDANGDDVCIKGLPGTSEMKP